MCVRARVCFAVLEGSVDEGEDLGFVEEFVSGMYSDDDMRGLSLSRR
jgi:hypothetical protein